MWALNTCGEPNDIELAASTRAGSQTKLNLAAAHGGFLPLSFRFLNMDISDDKDTHHAREQLRRTLVKVGRGRRPGGAGLDCGLACVSACCTGPGAQAGCRPAPRLRLGLRFRLL